MPGGELGSCADAIIASIHDGGMSADDHGSNVQSIAMLWRVFTTRLDDGTYGDLITRTNMHATFELHEQPNDQFKVTWNTFSVGASEAGPGAMTPSEACRGTRLPPRGHTPPS